MTRRAALVPALCLFTVVALGGCDREPDRTPAAAPVEDYEPAATSDDGPIPTAPEPRRIEMH